jgi:hypothetical protein
MSTETGLIVAVCTAIVPSALMFGISVITRKMPSTAVALTVVAASFIGALVIASKTGNF